MNNEQLAITSNASRLLDELLVREVCQRLTPRSAVRTHFPQRGKALNIASNYFGGQEK